MEPEGLRDGQTFETNYSAKNIRKLQDYLGL